MRRIGIQNLGLIVTNRCNLNCAHCLRGCKNNNDMSYDVIDATLDQIKIIGNLCLCGGEITFATNTLSYLFESIIKRKIFVEEVTTVINGTNYNEDFLKLLDNINEYISKLNNNNEISHATFSISKDDYHFNEIIRLNIVKEFMENIIKYQESKHYFGRQVLLPGLKLFREGNAKYLDKKITVKLRPMKTYATYIGKDYTFDRDNGLLYFGPLVTVSTEGIITECDSSIENMQKKYNYGNVLDAPLEEILLKRSRILKPGVCQKKWEDETNKYQSYNR